MLFDSGNSEELFAATPEEEVALIEMTCLRAGTDLAAFSDNQVARGLQYIFYNTHSDTVYSICRDGVALDRRISAVLAIRTLYTDCFARRCNPVLSHAGAAVGADNPLNIVCYMLWDMSPLGLWNKTVTQVMNFALDLRHPACVESALHGLGHRVDMDTTAVEAIDRYIKSGPPANLISYAWAARKGVIN